LYVPYTAVLAPGFISINRPLLLNQIITDECNWLLHMPLDMALLVKINSDSTEKTPVPSASSGFL